MDYNTLNQIMVKDKFSIPIIDKLFGLVKCSKDFFELGHSLGLPSNKNACHRNRENGVSNTSWA